MLCYMYLIIRKDGRIYIKHKKLSLHAEMKSDFNFHVYTFLYFLSFI